MEEDVEDMEDDQDWEDPEDMSDTHPLSEGANDRDAEEDKECLIEPISPTHDRLYNKLKKMQGQDVERI